MTSSYAVTIIGLPNTNPDGSRDIDFKTRVSGHSAADAFDAAARAYLISLGAATIAREEKKHPQTPKGHTSLHHTTIRLPDELEQAGRNMLKALTGKPEVSGYDYDIRKL